MTFEGLEKEGGPIRYSKEGSEQTTPKVKYTKELLRLKIDIELAVMTKFLGNNIHNQEVVSNWVKKYSGKFRTIFERKIREESNFLEKCAESQDEIANEIMLEMQKVQRRPLANKKPRDSVAR